MLLIVGYLWREAGCRRAALLPPCVSASHRCGLSAPLPPSTRIGRLTVPELHRNCGPHKHTGDESWRVDICSNAWAVWCQTLIISGGGGKFGWELCALCILDFAEHSGLPGCGCALDPFGSFWTSLRWCVLHTWCWTGTALSSPIAGPYPQHSSQLQEPGAAEDAEHTNWPSGAGKRFESRV